MHYDVIILGAGASGLFCAFTAAQRGRRVLVLERANKVGKKILMSGGGRCNFTNYSIEPNNFISSNCHFCKASLKRYSQWDFLSLVERYDIAFEERQYGQLFCLNSARDILNMLLTECENAGVDIRTNCQVSDVKAVEGAEDEGARFKLSAGKQSFTCQSLVVATGGLSIPTLGGSGDGYLLAEQFGLTLKPRQAGLVPFMFSDAMKGVCERLSGLALPVAVSCNEQQFHADMLFTHRGMSGPAMLQISNYWNPGDALTIDFLPDDDAVEWLLQEKQRSPKSLLRSVLGQRLSKSLTLELQNLLWTERGQTVMAEISDRDLRRVGESLNAFEVKPSATEGYRTAEVTRGGVDTDGLSSKTLEAKTQPGLYFIGEVVDVTGWLGGFNFQWAWSSGYSAGLHA
ncbi:MAG: aminoacetone oxidase family FAD-binding enzyme [Spongiibacteraceae bacterium]|nr:aminoacetone oxidase family FAD-binding enzyme [Spongiibacteraceae bacterium]